MHGLGVMLGPFIFASARNRAASGTLSNRPLGQVYAAGRPYAAPVLVIGRFLPVIHMSGLHIDAKKFRI